MGENGRDVVTAVRWDGALVRRGGMTGGPARGRRQPVVLVDAVGSPVQRSSSAHVLGLQLTPPGVSPMPLKSMQGGRT